MVGQMGRQLHFCSVYDQNEKTDGQGIRRSSQMAPSSQKQKAGGQWRWAEKDRCSAGRTCLDLGSDEQSQKEVKRKGDSG